MKLTSKYLALSFSFIKKMIHGGSIDFVGLKKVFFCSRLAQLYDLYIFHRLNGSNEPYCSHKQPITPHQYSSFHLF